MRIRTITGLAFAGVAAAAAVVAGGVAYAGDDRAATPVLQIVTEQEAAQPGTLQWSREDCPEKDGGGTVPAPGESGAPQQPAAPEQPAVPQESL